MWKRDSNRRRRQSVAETSTHTETHATGPTPEVPPRQVGATELNEVADGLVVFVAATQQVHYLNNTAAAVYVLCDGTRTPGEIVAASAEFFPGAQQWPQHVTACLADLRVRGLLA